MELPQLLLSFLLLVLLLGAVWLGGYRSRFKHIPGLRRTAERDYFIGLNYLLNDEPDDAIDIFTGALEINSGTLETHLALGTLLRRRGKVDRAIAYCHKLLDSGQFDEGQNAHIKLNLVRSYFAAGLLDRAEYFLSGLNQAEQPVRKAALELAIMVYQKEKEWAQALGVASDLLKICPVTRRTVLQLQCSHFHCELAEAALGMGNLQLARAELDKAASVFRSNVRVYFLLARVETAAGSHHEAVRHLQKIPDYDKDFAGDACTPLVKALQAAGMEQQLQELLDSAGEAGAGTRLLPALIPVIKEKKGEQAVLQMLQSQLKSNPSLGLLAQALDLAAEMQPSVAVVAQGALILQQFLQNCAHYRCESCGFELRNLHWQCPGCSGWGAVKPLTGKLPLL